MLSSTHSIAQAIKTSSFQKADMRVQSYFQLNNKVPQTEFLPYLNLKCPYSVMCLNALSPRSDSVWETVKPLGHGSELQRSIVWGLDGSACHCLLV